MVVTCEEEENEGGVQPASVELCSLHTPGGGGRLVVVQSHYEEEHTQRHQDGSRQHRREQKDGHITATHTHTYNIY